MKLLNFFKSMFKEKSKSELKSESSLKRNNRYIIRGSICFGESEFGQFQTSRIANNGSRTTSQFFNQPAVIRLIVIID